MWETRDPDGRRVVLTFARWRHIVDKHDNMRGQRGAVLRAVCDPEERIQGRGEHEEWFYGRTRRHDRWIRVVVHYEGCQGFIATAFPRRFIP